MLRLTRSVICAYYDLHGEGPYGASYDIKAEYRLKDGDLFYPLVMIGGRPCSRIFAVIRNGEVLQYDFYSEFDARTRISSARPTQDVNCTLLQVKEVD
jgi:hypothetical protein